MASPEKEKKTKQELLPSPPDDLSACLDGKFHVATKNYKKGKWDDLTSSGKMTSFWFKDCYCVIENVLYSVNDCTFRWYDTEVNMWREV
ncbi:BnaCnng73350D [Brassica napus]|uniref:BnaCnng73350D protein n=1 Tax=Brassica napus TaxID=3708 RepID=A0A078JXW0_BRANA|nr:BnaCnng73350D [Brassica napus]